MIYLCYNYQQNLIIWHDIFFRVNLYVYSKKKTDHSEGKFSVAWINIHNVFIVDKLGSAIIEPTT